MNKNLEETYGHFVVSVCKQEVTDKKKYYEQLVSHPDIDAGIKEELKKVEEKKKVLSPGLKRLNDFEERRHDYETEEITLVCGEKIKIYEINDQNSLVQFVSAAKYINRHSYKVYLRGQTHQYNGAMVPSLLRGNCNSTNRIKELKKNLRVMRESNTGLKDYQDIVLEPLLQHYGMKTRTLDLVDNLWIALWFGLYRAEARIVDGTEHISYVRRQPVERVYDIGEGKWKDEKQYAYIYLIATDALEETWAYGRKESNLPYAGIYEGQGTRLVDLRRALEPRFLRPHTQHGLMLLKTGVQDDKSLAEDYSDLIVGIAKVPVQLGFQWIGESNLLNVSTLFPSAVFDRGYAEIIKSIKDLNINIDSKAYGSIQIING